jgi:6-phosphofructokinase 1
MVSLPLNAPPVEWMVSTLGERSVPSPLALSMVAGDQIPDYVPDGMRVLHDAELSPGELPDSARSFEKAGPRERIFFEPKKTRAGIVTAGGLCPGTNNVIRSLVLHLVHKYGTDQVTGFRYGFAGLDPASGIAPITLAPDDVRHVHARGGRLLGTARGSHDGSVMVETLAAHRIDCLFAIGGDGTMRAAHGIAAEATRRGLKLAVVGIPKTIDNDIPFVDKTFGFETAVSMAKVAIDAAHTEALSVLNGIGLVKLMGRNAGFIAAHAALASHDVNVCLVPEVSFELEGPGGLLAYLEHRLKTRGHAVVVVAEGCGVRLSTAAGQGAAAPKAPLDASGNLRFASAELDIGTHLKHAVDAHFGKLGVPITLKYIDPSYMLRGVPATAMDAVFCDELARYAAHAAMAGKTDVMVGRWHRSFTHVPLPLVLSEKKRIDPDKELWLAVTETTGQPRFVR